MCTKKCVCMCTSTIRVQVPGVSLGERTERTQQCGGVWWEEVRAPSQVCVRVASGSV